MALFNATSKEIRSENTLSGSFTSDLFWSSDLQHRLKLPKITNSAKTFRKVALLMLYSYSKTNKVQFIFFSVGETKKKKVSLEKFAE